MMNGPSSEIHLRERQKLTSKSAAAGSASSPSSAAEGNATAGTCHHVTSGERCFCRAVGLRGDPCCSGKMGLAEKMHVWALESSLCSCQCRPWGWGSDPHCSSPAAAALSYLRSQMSPRPHRPLQPRGGRGSCRKGTGTV